MNPYRKLIKKTHSEKKLRTLRKLSALYNSSKLFINSQTKVLVSNPISMSMFSKKWWRDELSSFIATTATFAAVDGALLLGKLYEGNWDKMVLWQAGIIVLRSAVKSLLTMLFPKLFPLRLSVPKEQASQTETPSQ